MKRLRTEEEIRNYLILNKDAVADKLVLDALQVEEKYEKELLNGKYEYCVYADFQNNPYILEDERKIKFIEQIGGIVVYETISKCITTETRKFENKLNDFNVTLKQFQELREMWHNLSPGGQAEINDKLSVDNQEIWNQKKY